MLEGSAFPRDARRILLVTPSSPFPPDSGGAQRTALLYEALAADADVDLYLLGCAPITAHACHVLTNEFRMVGCFKDASSLLRRACLKLAAAVSPHLRSALADERKVEAIAAVARRGDL